MTDIRLAADKLLEQAKSLAKDIEPLRSHYVSIHETVSNILMVAWIESIKRGWEDAFTGELKSQMVVAKLLAKDDGHDRDDCVCMSYVGQQPIVCMVEKKPAVCLEMNLAGAVPLWCHYIPKVREAIDIAKKVSAD